MTACIHCAKPSFYPLPTMVFTCIVLFLRVFMLRMPIESCVLRSDDLLFGEISSLLVVLEVPVGLSVSLAYEYRGRP